MTLYIHTASTQPTFSVQFDFPRLSVAMKTLGLLNMKDHESLLAARKKKSGDEAEGGKGEEVMLAGRSIGLFVGSYRKVLDFGLGLNLLMFMACYNCNTGIKTSCIC